MMRNIILNTLLITCFCLISKLSFSQENPIEFKNGNLEKINKGEFYWWKNRAVKGGKAIFSVEKKDVNSGSKKSLKVKVLALGSKGFHVSTQGNSHFKVKKGGEYTVQFYAKGAGDIKLVFQSEVKNSFQFKNFSLTDEWKPYKHTFTAKETGLKNKIKFWYLTKNATYFLDDISVSK